MMSVGTSLPKPAPSAAPAWTQSSQLSAHLAQQSGMDGDEIFRQPIHLQVARSCSRLSPPPPTDSESCPRSRSRATLTRSSAGHTTRA